MLKVILWYHANIPSPSIFHLISILLMTTWNNYFTLGCKIKWLLSFISHTKIKIALEGKERRRRKPKHEEDFLSKQLILQMRKLMTIEVMWLSCSHKGLETGPPIFRSVFMLFHVLLLTSPDMKFIICTMC